MTQSNKFDEGSPDKNYIVQLNQELNAAKEELTAYRERCERYDHLFSEMSHELRTPMSVVLLFAKLLVDEVKSEDPEFQTKAFNAINTNIKKAYQLFGFFMSSWHILAYLHKEPNLEKTSLAEVFPRFDFSISTSLDSFPPANIDRYMIESAVGQFSEILNDDSSNDVSLSTSLKNDWIILSLNNRKKVLPDYFYPTDDTGNLDCTSRSHSNPLCIGADLIKKHGGEVRLDISEETGTTLTFTLPVYKEKTPPSK